MKRPNILLIYTDQQRFDALGAQGNPDIRTPNLDKLAAESLMFTQCVVQNPVCMPSRVSMLSSLYPSALGIFTNGTTVSENTVTLPVMLKNYGYTTANIGKLHFLPHANRDHRNIHPAYGFDHLEIADEPGCYEDAYYAWVRAKDKAAVDYISCGLPPAATIWRDALMIPDTVTHPAERFPKRPVPFRASADLTFSAFVAEQSMAFLDRHATEPFFLVAGFYSPHSPWIAPQEYIDMYDPDSLAIARFPDDIAARRTAGAYSDDELRLATQGYYAMVSEMDHHAGRIIQHLETLGIADNTIVVFTSDHGERLGEQLSYGKGQPGFDCDTRVPLLIRWRDGIASPGLVSDIIEAVDIVPSLVHAAGIPVPPHVQGKVVDLRAGKCTTRRASALIEMETCKALRTERFRYTLFRDGRETLFDYNNAYAEYRDVSDEPEYADALSGLRRELAFRQMEMERPRDRDWCY